MSIRVESGSPAYLKSPISQSAGNPTTAAAAGQSLGEIRGSTERKLSPDRVAIHDGRSHGALRVAQAATSPLYCIVSRRGVTIHVTEYNSHGAPRVAQAAAGIVDTSQAMKELLDLTKTIRQLAAVTPFSPCHKTTPTVWLSVTRPRQT